MLERLLPCCFIHELVLSFRNTDETWSTGTAQNGSYVSWQGRGYCRLSDASISFFAQNLMHTARASTNLQWK